MKRAARILLPAARTASEYLNRRTVRFFVVFTVLSLLLCRLICVFLIPRCEPTLIMHPCYQEHLAQRLKAHHDCHMVSGLLPNFGTINPFSLVSPGPLSATNRKSALVAGTSCATRERLFPSDLARPMALSFSADVPPRH